MKRYAVRIMAGGLDKTVYASDNLEMAKVEWQRRVNNPAECTVIRLFDTQAIDRNIPLRSKQF